MLIEFGCKGTTFSANNRLFLRIFVCELLELFFFLFSAIELLSRFPHEHYPTGVVSKKMDVQKLLLPLLRAIRNRPYSQ